jgi:hypothetical protein
MYPGAKRKRPSAPTPKGNESEHDNHGPFNPAPKKQDMGDTSVSFSTEGLDYLSGMDEKDTGRDC